jgi:hypothetical protein
MAEADVELLTQDATVTAAKGSALRESCTLRDDSYFLDGPVCRRVAVVDFDPVDGRPQPAPAPFVPDPQRPANGTYSIAGLGEDHPAALAVNAFGTVMDTIAMVEEPNGLGRRIGWGFDGPQLLVVPRAGEWANAFYERATRSLQFFSFTARQRWIHTALSRDIVAHECAHAILDGVVPTLYDAITPQSHAIHEAVADLVAVLMAVRSRALRARVLAETGGRIDESTAFNSIAEDFGGARLQQERPGALRDLNERRTLAETDPTDPHALSVVLSGALYQTLVDVFDGYAADYRRQGSSPEAAAEKALAVSGPLFFRRLLLRGLDYLPPGELTFADVARALLAADRAAYPDTDFPRSADGRGRLADRMIDRGIAASRDELLLGAPGLPPVDVDLEAIRDSDWAAYRFVERLRPLLGIPADGPIIVHPRVDATKLIYLGFEQSGASVREQRELLVKVSWDHIEANGVRRLRAARRVIRTGATLAIEWDSKQVLAVLRSDAADPASRDSRDAMIRRLLEENALVVDRVGATVRPTAAPAVALVEGGTARIKANSRLLHLSGRA